MTADSELPHRDVRLAMYAPEDGGINDHCILRADDGSRYFHIHRQHEKAEAASTPPQESKAGHAFSEDPFNGCIRPQDQPRTTWWHQLLYQLTGFGFLPAWRFLA